jgi:hypothetical protein
MPQPFPLEKIELLSHERGTVGETRTLKEEP